MRALEVRCPDDHKGRVDRSFSLVPSKSTSKVLRSKRHADFDSVRDESDGKSKKTKRV